MRLASSPRIPPSVLHQQGLGETRHADQQGMAAGEQRDERALTITCSLAEDDSDRGLVDALDTLAGRL
jgi:hypothetical protein